MSEETSTTTPVSWDAIVIGSGMGGMITAAALSRLGHKVLLLEQYSTLGGQTHSFSRNGFTWDAGIHYLGKMGAPERLRMPILVSIASRSLILENRAMTETATLQIGGQTVELPIVSGVHGEKGLDITKLRGQTGVITFDPGYGNTGSCASAITFIDPERGELRYRGIPIEQLAVNSSFIEVAYLLIHGALPNRAELEAFDASIGNHTLLHEDMKDFFGALPKDAHPMAACSAAAGALSTFYPDSLDPRDAAHARELEASRGQECRLDPHQGPQQVER